MSVKLIDNQAFYGFRVRRTVNGKLYQEYMSLKKAGKRLGPRQTRSVERLAEARPRVVVCDYYVQAGTAKVAPASQARAVFS